MPVWGSTSLSWKTMTPECGKPASSARTTNTGAAASFGDLSRGWETGYLRRYGLTIAIGAAAGKWRAAAAGYARCGIAQAQRR